MHPGDPGGQTHGHVQGIEGFHTAAWPIEDIEMPLIEQRVAHKPGGMRRVGGVQALNRLALADLLNGQRAGVLQVREPVVPRRFRAQALDDVIRLTEERNRLMMQQFRPTSIGNPYFDFCRQSARALLETRKRHLDRRVRPGEPQPIRRPSAHRPSCHKISHAHITAARPLARDVQLRLRNTFLPSRYRWPCALIPSLPAASSRSP